MTSVRAKANQHSGAAGSPPRTLWLAIGVLILLAGCASPPPADTPAAPSLTAPSSPTQHTPAPSTDSPSSTATPPSPTATPFPENVNPLTGLTVDNPAVLARRPLLLKVSNYPAVVRPQNGLSYADHVWEHVVEGFEHTRLTAVFYGQTPESVGSIRSGRPPDLEIVPMYEGLYAASGFSRREDPAGPPRMRELMTSADWFERNLSAEFGVGSPAFLRFPIDGLAYEHTLFAIPAELWRVAEERGVNDPPDLPPALAFSDVPPEGGNQTATATIDYEDDGPRAEWHYDAESGRWLRRTDGVSHGDYLTGQQLGFENVVIVYTEHYETDFIEYQSATARQYGVGAVLVGEGDAVLLRDGQRYSVRWVREGEDMMRLVDDQGRDVPLKPGQTWFNLASTTIAPPEVTFE